jgi:hypothetical protein
MYGHCFFNTDGSLVADMSTRLVPQGIQQVEGLQASASGGIDTTSRRTRRRRDSALASSEIVVRGMDFIQRVEPEAEARRVRSEAVAAEHAKSIVRGNNLDSLLEQVERYQKKLQVEENHGTVDDVKVDIYRRVVSRLYEDLNKLV